MKAVTIIIASLANVTRRDVLAHALVPSRAITNRHIIVPSSSCRVPQPRRQVVSHPRGIISTRIGAVDDDDDAPSTDDDATTTYHLGDYYDTLLSMFQGDFDNYRQVVRDRQRGLTPGDGGGHEHMHCTLVPHPRIRRPRRADIGNDDDGENDILVIEGGGGDGHDDIVGEWDQHWVLAAFYFDGDPTRIFRFRLYQLLPSESDDGRPMVRMKLRTLASDLEERLRSISDEPCHWWNEVWNALLHDDGDGMPSEDATDECRGTEILRKMSGSSTAISSYLAGCDVIWDPNWDRADHTYLYANEYDDDDDDDDASHRADHTTVGGDGGSSTRRPPPLPSGTSCHATMEAGSDGAIVDSISMMPGRRILIKDELSIWRDEFWINDRGYDPDNKLDDDDVHDDVRWNAIDDVADMPFVYGNRRGVPYKMRRVSNFVDADVEDRKPPRLQVNIGSGLHRRRDVVNVDLQWTLGESFRTQEFLKEKMKRMKQGFDDAR